MFKLNEPFYLYFVKNYIFAENLIEYYNYNPNFNKMKRILNFQFILIILVSALVMTGCSWSKKMIKNYPEVKYQVTPKVLEAHGGEVTYEVKATIPPKYFHRKANVYFAPVLEYPGGKIDMPAVQLRGEKVKGEGQQIKFKEGGTVTYSQKFAFEPKLKVAELKVTPAGYKSKTQRTINSPEDLQNMITIGSTKLADGIIATSTRVETAESLNEFRWKIDDNGNPVEKSSFGSDLLKSLETNRMLNNNDPKNRFSLGEMIIVEHDYQKEVIVKESAGIYFAKDKFNLDWKQPQNKVNNADAQLAKLKDFYAKGWQIKDITIDGWASPEGEETRNTGLSENRGKTARTLLFDEVKKMAKAKDPKSKYDPSKDLNVRLTGHGPDWNGFKKLVQASNVKDKSAIMNVVNFSDPKKQEEEIRNMILIYPELEKELLPPLRRSIIEISCYEPRRTDEQISKLATTYPDSLSVSELLYAGTLTNNLNTQLKIYESASTVYKNDWRGFNNAAFIAMKMGDVRKAENLIEKASKLEGNNGIVLNNQGVVKALNKSYTEAETLFNKSKNLGVDQNYNLAVISIPKGKYNQTIDFMKAKNCDYNLGLAQLLSGNAQAAGRTLECAPKTAATYYLLAIVGARTNNAQLMIDNLDKAIKANGKYKAEARDDREFINYFNDEQFKKLVQ